MTRQQLRISAIAATLLLSALVASTTLADDGKGRDGGRPHHGRFFEADRNADGKVTLEEARQGARERFQKMDADKNGLVTREEAKKAHEAARKERQEAHQKDGDAPRREPPAGCPEGGRHQRDEGRGPDGKTPFDRMDADGSGSVTESEAVAGVGKMFALLDQNRDGAVTREEARAAHRDHRGPRDADEGKPAQDGKKK